ncbi:hypothetical protein [Sedimentisphaera salicampi]|uniref:Uncharacterized protein n=1 Tax=Sedimentisphaera salicampi TaxID=1941349 RepID=A0A1W6LP52_9BACT|nr:hypothetical protein [Sedimentisphaera salicampi]ARN57537.1 hypothetical protein STSP1_01948 [Sedimentisphaera salicampi]OXU14399.1 hypothetical protein SMSP1_01863 [Sedimentisphaera salicampi]
MKIKLFSFMRTDESKNHRRRLTASQIDEIMHQSDIGISQNQKEEVYKKIEYKLNEIDSSQNAEPSRRALPKLKFASSIAAGILLLAGAFFIYSNTTPQKPAQANNAGKHLNFSTALPDISFTPETMYEREVENIEQDIKSGIDFLQGCMPKGVNQPNSKSDSET